MQAVKYQNKKKFARGICWFCQNSCVGYAHAECMEDYAAFLKS